MSQVAKEEVLEGKEGGSLVELVNFPVEYVSIEEVKPHPRNYRVHPADQIEHLMESIKAHGLYRPVVIAEDGTILAGHGVVIAARRLGLPTVPIRRLPLHPDEPRALKLLTGDNEISHLGEVDDRVLTEILKQIKEEDSTGLLGTGYDDKMLANLIFVTRPASEVATFNEAAEWVGMPDYEEGGESSRLIISFENDALRDEFIRLYDIPEMRGRTRNTWSTFWPKKERDDSSSVKFEG